MIEFNGVRRKSEMKFRHTGNKMNIASTGISRTAADVRAYYVELGLNLLRSLAMSISFIFRIGGLPKDQPNMPLALFKLSFIL